MLFPSVPQKVMLDCPVVASNENVVEVVEAVRETVHIDVSDVVAPVALLPSAIVT